MLGFCMRYGQKSQDGDIKRGHRTLCKDSIMLKPLYGIHVLCEPGCLLGLGECNYMSFGANGMIVYNVAATNVHHTSCFVDGTEWCSTWYILINLQRIVGLHAG